MFASSVASASKKISKPSKIPLAPDVFIRPASLVCQRIKPPISRICPSHFKILESPGFATKDNYCHSTILISGQSHAGRGIYDKWSTSLSRFCLYSRFCPIFTQEKSFFGSTFEDLSGSDKPSALGKCWWWQETTYSLVRKGPNFTNAKN